MPENLDLVRSIYAAWERGDFNPADWPDPDIEYVMREGPSPSIRRGVAAMNAVWRNFLGSWDDYHAEVDGYRELEDERVLALLQGTGTGRTSRFNLGS